MKKIILIFSLLMFVFLLKTNNVTAQSCTTSPPNNTGTSTLSTTTTAGTYRVWSRIKAADTTNNNFYLRIDSNCAVLVGDSSSISSSTWTWVDYQNGTATNKINATLTSGNHVITLIGNEPGVSVDKVLLTKNLTCVPTGFGDNCPAETPTPTTTPDTTPPVISAVSATNTTEASTNITWTLNEPSTGRVEYGTTTSYGSLSAPETSFNYTTHVQAISGLSPNTTYHYRVKSSDQADNQATSGDFTFKTLSGPQGPTTAPTCVPRPGCLDSVPACKLPITADMCPPSPTPPITPLPQQTVLHFGSVKLHGIGTGGDNSIDPNNPPPVLGNPNPLTKTRVLKVELYTPAGTLLSSAQANIIYSANTGDFSGDVILDSSIPSSSYLIKVKTDKYLRRQLSGIITLTKGTTVAMPAAVLAVGDINGDAFRSIADYNILIGCYSDLLPAKDCDVTRKFNSDISDDGNVNQDDYNLYLRETSVQTGD